MEPTASMRRHDPELSDRMDKLNRVLPAKELEEAFAVDNFGVDPATKVRLWSRWPVVPGKVREAGGPKGVALPGGQSAIDQACRSIPVVWPSIEQLRRHANQLDRRRRLDEMDLAQLYREAVINGRTGIQPSADDLRNWLNKFYDCDDRISEANAAWFLLGQVPITEKQIRAHQVAIDRPPIDPEVETIADSDAEIRAWQDLEHEAELQDAELEEFGCDCQEHRGAVV